MERLTAWKTGKDIASGFTIRKDSFAGCGNISEGGRLEVEQRDQLLQDPEFHELSRKRNAITAVLTLLILAVYYGYIFLIAFKKELLAYKFTTNVTAGIPLGISVILISWLLTGIYVRWANRKYDPLVQRLKDKIET